MIGEDHLHMKKGERTLRGKCPNMELFLVRIWTLFKQWKGAAQEQSLVKQVYLIAV